MITALLFAVFVWWFSTGAIFWAISHGAGRGTVLMSAPLAISALFAMSWAANEGGATGAYVGFSAAIVIWGWFEIAFLTGVLTGPNTRACPPGLNGMRHFLMAWGTIAYSELALLMTAIVIGVLTWHAPDHTGLWTFLILFFARISAKLNVYLGVPNLSHEMMPGAIAYMKTYFANRRMNWLFPAAITLLTFAVACWIERAIATDGSATGFLLLTGLTTLALVEHWLMVLPIQDAALWRWMVRQPAHDPSGAEPVE